MVVCNVCLAKNTTEIQLNEVTQSPGYGAQKKALNHDKMDFCTTCRDLLVKGKFDELGKRVTNLDKAVIQSLKNMAGSLDHSKPLHPDRF